MLSRLELLSIQNQFLIIANEVKFLNFIVSAQIVETGVQVTVGHKDFKDNEFELLITSFDQLNKEIKTSSDLISLYLDFILEDARYNA